MKLTKYLSLAGMLAAGGVAWGQADAVTITAKINNLASNSPEVAKVTYSQDSGSTWASVGGYGGVFDFTLTAESTSPNALTELLNLQIGQHFLAICIDPKQDISLQTSHDFTLGVLTDAPQASSGYATAPQFSQQEANFFASVLANQFGSNDNFVYKGNNAYSQSEAIYALEMLLWEAVLGNDVPLGLSSGNVWVTNENSPTKTNPANSTNWTQAEKLASQWVTDYWSKHPNSGKITTLALMSTGTQDFLVYTDPPTIPAPAPLALLGLGLISLFGVRRLRSA